MKLLKFIIMALLGICPFAYAVTPVTTPAVPVVSQSLVQTATPAASVPINGIVAVVNNGVITQLDLDQAVAQAQMQITQSGLPMPDTLTLQKQVLHQLILQKIALELATLNHISVSNQQVDIEIENIAKHNNLQISQLKTMLKQQGINYVAYWDNIRDHLVINKLEQQAVANNILITPTEVDNYLAAKAKMSNPDTEYEVQHILLPLPDDPTAANLAKAQAQANDIVKQIKGGLSFTKAAMQFSQSDDALQGGDLGWKTADQLPAVFANPVQGMVVGQIIGPIQSDTGFHIIKLVGTRTSSTAQHFVDQSHVRAILIKTSPIVSDKRAQEILNNLRDQIQKGADFANIAKANSQDVKSTSDGGDMGWLSADMVNSTFADQMKTTPVNGVSQPFQSPDGWYIIQVLGTRQFDDTKDYMKQQAQEYLFQQKANQAVQSWQNEIYGDSYIQILDPDLQSSS